MFTVTAEPTQAFVDAISARLRADTTLMALVTDVLAHLSEAQRTAYPYLVLGRRHLTRDAGAMGLAGGIVELQIDGWSDYKGPLEMQQMLSRVSVLLERQPLVVTGFDLLRGSLTCTLSDVDDEPDEDKPGARLWHGVQHWTAEIHESI